MLHVYLCHSSGFALLVVWRADLMSHIESKRFVKLFALQWQSAHCIHGNNKCPFHISIPLLVTTFRQISGKVRISVPFWVQWLGSVVESINSRKKHINFFFLLHVFNTRADQSRCKTFFIWSILTSECVREWGPSPTHTPQVHTSASHTHRCLKTWRSAVIVARRWKTHPRQQSGQSRIQTELGLM